jgi:dienelactone hydrolase
VSPRRRAWDAFSAARWLGARADIDKTHLVLQGDSHGGWTTLVALEVGKWPTPAFAAGIAFYPFCYDVSGFTAPLLVLIGASDDWTPAARCTAMTKRLTAASAAGVELKIFPGATHAYDFPLPARTNRLGHFMTYDAAATEASWQAIDAFLAAHIK